MNWAEIIKEACNKKHVSAEGKISCSSLPTIELCGGSYDANAKVERVSKKYDAEGTALHYCMERNLIPDDMPDELKEKMGKASNAVQYLQAQGWEVFETEVFGEDKELCGTPDVVFRRMAGNGIMGYEYLILDFKFGWQKVDDSTAQIFGYSRIFREKNDCARLYSCIVQPERDDANIVLMDDEKGDLKIVEIIENRKRGQRSPSEKACQFCDACGTFACPETQNISQELASPELNTEEISVENMRKHAHLIPIMKKALDGFRSQVEKYLNEGGQIEGACMKEGHMLYSISSIPAAIQGLSGIAPAHEVLNSCTISAKAVKDILVKNDVCSEKDSQNKAMEMLGEAFVGKKSKDSLRFLS